MTGTHSTNRGTGSRGALAALACVAVVVAVWLALPVSSASAAKTLSGTFVIAQDAPTTTTPGVVLLSRVRSATLMRFKNSDGSFTLWEPYATTKAWVLSAGDGVKTVEAQYKGATGSRVVLLDDILLDSTGPVTTSDYDGVPRRIVAVTLTPADALSAVAGTWYRLDGGPWTAGLGTTLRIWRKRSGLAPGAHTLEYYSTDVLGNVGAVGADVITLQY